MCSILAEDEIDIKNGLHYLDIDITRYNKTKIHNGRYRFIDKSITFSFKLSKKDRFVDNMTVRVQIKKNMLNFKYEYLDNVDDYLNKLSGLIEFYFKD